ncbi:hypothetical protein NPX13_g7954 [Xylaria arbuscula]|uniref:Uncharacterized protein n=1 Tax=Xylaria arbuscula TaxID=114810 RepID=A0A9W8TJX0_9PEZI|nr:hypothetical protein NPX13_g7954 [Xylaria arbuscula]
MKTIILSSENMYVLSPNRVGYYPHYGTTVVPSDVEPNLVVLQGGEPIEDLHVLVAEEDLCDSVVLDEQGFWLNCSGGAPIVTELKDVFVGGVNPPGPTSLCEDCKDNCYRIPRRMDRSADKNVLDQLSVSSGQTSEGSPPPNQAPDANSQNESREYFSIRERIYRNVLRILGYPENTPIPWDSDPVLRAQPPL